LPFNGYKPIAAVKEENKNLQYTFGWESYVETPKTYFTNFMNY
jgi:hypothetical protein